MPSQTNDEQRTMKQMDDFQLHGLPIESEDDLRILAGSRARDKATLYVPITPVSTERHANELELRAARNRLGHRLRERGLGEREVGEWVEGLLDAAPALDSLDSNVRTLGCFGDERGWFFAALPEDLGMRRHIVSSEFALRPLIWSLRRDRPFRLLAVSGNRVAAYVGGAFGLRQIEVKGLPNSLEDALGSEIEPESLSYRNEKPVPGQKANAPVYHGHGGANAARTNDRERFLRRVAGAIQATWAGDDVPIVLAAEERAASELRAHLDLETLLDAEVRGNVDGTSDTELHRRARPLVRAALASDEARLAAGHEAARNAGKTLIGPIDAMGEAVVAGRVRRLSVDRDARVGARFDHTTGRSVDTRDADEDALDGLVAGAIRRRGEIVVMHASTPPDPPWSAVLR